MDKHRKSAVRRNFFEIRDDEPVFFDTHAWRTSEPDDWRSLSKKELGEKRRLAGLEQQRGNRNDECK